VGGGRGIMRTVIAGAREKEKNLGPFLCQHTLKHIRGDWSHYTDTNEPVVGYETNNMVTVQSRILSSDLLIASPTR
jgi:hypothetical protein